MMRMMSLIPAKPTDLNKLRSELKRLGLIE
jgi:hypothetical protein